MSLRSSVDEKFMRAALLEAAKGVGRASPNPAVGAVVVSGARIIGRGFHRGAGFPHAEIEALGSLKSRAAAGTTLYVTLEPCSTWGRTPPCVDAIVAAGVAKVVFGAIDPNPAHSRRAAKILREAGVRVQSGVLAGECRLLNPWFEKWITTGVPWVIAKAGMSLDARLTRRPGEGQWITSPVARAVAHELRATVDAILIGGGTLRADNPRLTTRGIPGASQPWRVVVSRSGVVPRNAHLFTDEFAERTLLYTGRSLRSVLRDLGRRQITSVLIEGGSRLLGEAFDRQLVDRAHFFVAPLLLGGPAPVIGGLGVAASSAAPRIIDPVYQRLGDELHLSGNVTFKS